MQKYISVERNERERSYKKYNKIDLTLSIVETMAECSGIAAGSIGIASLASVVAAPVGFVLEGVAVGLGGVAMKYARYKITKKLKKHSEIRVLAEMKEQIRTKFTPKDAPPDIKARVDKKKLSKKFRV